jgi:hypothetical protein
MRFRFVEDRRADYPVRILCDVLGVSPAGYYAWRSRPESRRSAANRDLVDDIQQVHREAYGRYGSPRIHAELRAQGRGASRGRVERLMRRRELRPLYRQRLEANAVRGRPSLLAVIARPCPPGVPAAPGTRPHRRARRLVRAPLASDASPPKRTLFQAGSSSLRG